MIREWVHSVSERESESKTIDTLPWHEALLRQLQSTQERERLPNALALVCATGWGLSVLAERAVQTIADLEPEQIPSQLAHQDVRWIEPDGAVLKIDQIRLINDFAVHTVQLAPRKVALVLHAERLNANAANALLKTLEEPPKNTHIVLATEHWGKLLPTIRSRCQRWIVKPDNGMAMNWLEQTYKTVDLDRFADAGFAPLLYNAESLPITTLLARIRPAKDSQITLGQLLKGEGLVTTEFLARWYRHTVRMVAESLDQHAAEENSKAEALQRLGEKILDVRRQLLTSNAANETLLLEDLTQGWRKLGHSAL